MGVDVDPLIEMADQMDTLQHDTLHVILIISILISIFYYPKRDLIKVGKFC